MQLDSHALTLVRQLSRIWLHLAKPTAKPPAAAARHAATAIGLINLGQIPNPTPPAAALTPPVQTECCATHNANLGSASILHTLQASPA